MLVRIRAVRFNFTVGTNSTMNQNFLLIHDSFWILFPHSFLFGVLLSMTRTAFYRMILSLLNSSIKSIALLLLLLLKTMVRIKKGTGKRATNMEQAHAMSVGATALKQPTKKATKAASSKLKAKKKKPAAAAPQKQLPPADTLIACDPSVRLLIN